jgi:hypothetical protein
MQDGGNQPYAVTLVFEAKAIPVPIVARERVYAKGVRICIRTDPFRLSERSKPNHTEHRDDDGLNHLTSRELE